MQDTIDTAQIDECPIAGDILDRSFQDDTFFNDLQDLCLRVSRSFSSRARRDTTTLPRARLNFRIAKRSFVPMNLSKLRVGRTSTWDPGKNPGTPTSTLNPP